MHPTRWHYSTGTIGFVQKALHALFDERQLRSQWTTGRLGLSGATHGGQPQMAGQLGLGSQLGPASSNRSRSVFLGERLDSRLSEL